MIIKLISWLLQVIEIIPLALASLVALIITAIVFFAGTSILVVVGCFWSCAVGFCWLFRGFRINGEEA